MKHASLVIIGGNRHEKTTLTKAIKETLGIKDEDGKNDATFKITALTNIREYPSLDSHVVGLVEAGQLIRGTLEGNWIETSKGFILYGDGAFAQKM